jgi:hypothetical protein
MIRVFTIWFVLIFCIAAAGFGQTTNIQEKPVKKFELRPSSRDYAPVRRGNAYQHIQRSKKPTGNSQQSVAKKKNVVKGEQKAPKRKEVAPAIRKNRRIKR